MVKKVTKRKGDYLLCMTCNHEEPIKIDASALKLEAQNGEPVSFTDEENA
jgi:hypothetical protein